MDNQGITSPGWSLTIKVVVAVLGIVLIGLAAYTFRAVFVPLIIAAIMAYVLTPFVKLVERTTRLPHGLATGLVYLLLLALVIPLLIVFVPRLFEQANMLVNQIILYIRSLGERSTDTVSVMGFQVEIGALVQEVTDATANILRTALPGTVGVVLSAARILLFAVFTFVLGFYLTRDRGRILDALQGFVPQDYREDVRVLGREIDQVWAAFLRGQVLLSLTVMVILTIISTVLGLPQPLLLGIWGGLLEFLPSIGNIIWGTTAILLAIIEGSSYLPFPPAVFVIIVIVTYIVFAQIDINILIPNIIGSQVQLHPMVVLLGVIVGLSVGGVLGVALAAPTIASLRIIGRYIYAKLFDLDPFPMVGPPAAPPEERLAHARLVAGLDAGPTSPYSEFVQRTPPEVDPDNEAKE